MKTIEMEIALALHFNYRLNLIVPNVSWGLGLHECDLLIMSKAGYLTEIEIKISKSDLIKDKEKCHGHRSRKIKYLYFAIPEELIKDISHIPKRAGIIIVRKHLRDFSCRIYRKPKQNKILYVVPEKEQLKLAKLGSMRIWGLKKKLINRKNHE